MSASHFLCIITNEGKYHAGCNIIFRASLLNIDTADTNPFRYCAEYFDAETGQIYLRNRYYQPVTGRFSQLDPIRDGLNWYAYYYNNPVRYIDSNGLVGYEIKFTFNRSGFDKFTGAVENYSPNYNTTRQFYETCEPLIENIPVVGRVLQLLAYHFGKEEDKGRQNEVNRIKESVNISNSYVSGYTYEVYIVDEFDKGMKFQVKTYNESGKCIDEFTCDITFQETFDDIEDFAKSYATSYEERDY